MAIRSGIDWRFDPGPEDVISEGDVLLDPRPRGGREPGSRARGRPRSSRSVTEGDAPPLSELDRAVDILVEMKDLAEAAVGSRTRRSCSTTGRSRPRWARSRAVADILEDELESWVLRAAPEARNVDELRGPDPARAASRSICDAARDMTWYVEHGEPLHPVSRWRSKRPRRPAAEMVVEPGRRRRTAGLRELRVETETGMFVLGVQRGPRWSYRPRAGSCCTPATG